MTITIDKNNIKGFAVLIFLISYAIEGYSQDIPLFTQKLTNSFLYNPSVAGNTMGSFTISRRQYWSGVDDSPSTNFLSMHVPFGYHKFGLGFNLYQDNIGVSNTTSVSGAFAYHLKFTDEKAFSMGVSAEYANFSVRRNTIDVIDTDDVLLNELSTYGQVDFAFGASYQSKFFKAGASTNRIGDFLGLKDSTVNEFPAYYSAFLNVMLPLSERGDMLEPIVTYRSLAPGSHQVDAGLFYTFRNLLTLGGGYRTGGIANVTAAVRYKGVLVGYSREMLSANYQRNLGSTNEITLRIDFRDHNEHTKLKNPRKINTQALAVRRKTLSTYSSGGTSMQKSERYKKKLRRNYIHSPNYRISSSKKLQSVKKKKMPGYNRKKRYKHHNYRRRR